MKHRITPLLAALLLSWFLPALAFAACSLPAGNAGHIINNAAYNVLQYCDGTNWIAMGPHGAGGSVGWWKLDESSGPTATDSSGSGNNGTWTNAPTYTASGKINGALTLASASSQYVDAGDAASLRLAGSWTVSTWVNPSALPASSNYTVLVDKDNSSGSGTNYNLFIDNGAVSAGLGWITAFNATGCCDNHYAKYVATISTGTWYHVAGVYDSVAQTLTLYLNGASVASSSVGGSTPEHGGGNSLLLGSIAGAPQFLNGTLDDVRVYNRALNAAQISQILPSPSSSFHQPTRPGLVQPEPVERFFGLGLDMPLLPIHRWTNS